MTVAVALRRRVQWMDTDAAGIWHHSTIVRWAEEAEAELHRRLGIIDSTFGATPRVHVEFDFSIPVRFDDEVIVELSVVQVGESSVTYAITVSHGSRQVAVGRMVAVFIDRSSGEKRPWPPELLQALGG